MDGIRWARCGFQQLSGMSAATGLTLPVGSQLAQASGATLSGNILTVGGTVTGTFAVGQVVQGTGIPANTIITRRLVAPNQWLLSNACTTESAEQVTAYAPIYPDFALLKALTQNVSWRDDGTAPTAAIGNLLQTSDAEFVYPGPLTQVQFIQVTSGAVLNVGYYTIAG